MTNYSGAQPPLRWMLTKPFAVVAVVALASGCAGRIPLPKHLEVSGVGELLERMEAASVAAQGYSAEARLTYFGPEGRIKGTAVVVVQKPNKLRYDVVGPHGGVLSAFATDGVQVQLMDLRAMRFVYGSATAANIDALLGVAPLGLAPEGWVALLFGRVRVPADARLHYDAKTGRFVLRWQTTPHTIPYVHEVQVDPATSRSVGARIAGPAGVVWEVAMADHDTQGLPHTLEVHVPPHAMHLRAALRDVIYDGDIDPSLFTLTPPADMPRQSLDRQSFDRQPLDRKSFDRQSRDGEPVDGESRAGESLDAEALDGESLD